MVKYITPAVTPLSDNGSIDIEGMEFLYHHLIQGGIDGILILGSIGEFFALPSDMKKRIIHEAIRIVNHRVPLMVGVSGMVFDEVVDLACYAFEEGAESVISVPPYYFGFKPDSIENYYSAMAETVHGSIYLYNFPDRTGYSIPTDTVKNLALKYENIVGIKDTIPGLDHTREIIKAVKPIRSKFEVFSGFDDNFAHNALCGGDGCIAGLSNLVPDLCSRWRDAVNQGNYDEIAEGQRRIDRLMDIYSVGTPFIPYIKAAMQEIGLPMRSVTTFPQPVPTEDDRKKLRMILEKERVL